MDKSATRRSLSRLIPFLRYAFALFFFGQAPGNAQETSHQTPAAADAGSEGTVKITANCPGDTAAFNYPDFTTAANLNQFHSAQTVAGVLRLTDAPGQNGSAIYSGQLPMADGFESVFAFQITDPAGALDAAGAPGGDGFALVIQSQG